jgi:predicted Zn-dependent peptidase
MAVIQTPNTGIRRRHDTAVFEKHQLANGIIVWRQRSPVLLNDEGVLMAIFPKVGSILDPNGKEGLAHFFEHLPFKGTKQFPSTPVLTEAVRSKGGEDNAGTNIFWTRYYVSMPQRSYADAVRILHSLITEPLFRPEDIETERGVIMSEYERFFAKGASLVYRDVSEKLYTGHPLGRFGIGTREGITGTTHDDILSFRNAYYHAGNLQLIVGGSFADEKDLLPTLDATFGSVARMESEPQLPPLLPAHPVTTEVLQNKQYGRDRLFIDWLLPPADRTSGIALSLLLQALGSGFDSPLVLELRDRLGLTYETNYASVWRTILGWHLNVLLPVPTAQFDTVHDTFFKTLRELSTERIVTTLERWQLDRLSSFTSPIRACSEVAEDILLEGVPRSYRDDEAAEDSIDMDAVEKWRHYILETPPFIARTTASDPA